MVHPLWLLLLLLANQLHMCKYRCSTKTVQQQLGSLGGWPDPKGTNTIQVLIPSFSHAFYQPQKDSVPPKNTSTVPTPEPTNPIPPSNRGRHFRGGAGPGGARAAGTAAALGKRFPGAAPSTVHRTGPPFSGSAERRRALR